MIAKTALAFAAPILLGIGAASPAAYASGGTISACPTVIPSTATGTWTVTKNLTARGNCITIEASGVAIDLHGYTITGPGIGTGDGITDGGSCKPKCQQNIIIANGTVQGFQYGIYLTSTASATLSHLNVTQNAGAGIWLVQDYPVVSDSGAGKNGHYGMYFGGSGNTVNNSSANSNGDYGMYFKGSGNTVNDSGASANGYGMWFVGGNNSVNNSSAGSNEYEGMTFTDGGNAVNNSAAGSNDASGNGYYGMYFASGGNTITDSLAVFNAKADGIFINGSSNFLTGALANNNGGIGISVVCPSNLYGNTASKNTGGNIVTSGGGCARLGDNPAP
jgi:Periplasmic copper-binding protein (NosD)